MHKDVELKNAIAWDGITILLAIDLLPGYFSDASAKTAGAKRYYSKRVVSLLHAMVFCGFARPAAYLACDERT